MNDVDFLVYAIPPSRSSSRKNMTRDWPSGEGVAWVVDSRTASLRIIYSICVNAHVFSSTRRRHRHDSV